MKTSYIATFAIALAIESFALPQNPSIVSGSAAVAQPSSQILEISAADQIEIHWKDFSIGADELVRFIQPSSKSIALNRVLEAYPSKLLGNLEATGQVLLINPNGILVGKDAIINTGSFIASTLDLKSYEFAQEWVFAKETTSSVVNLGKIMALDGDALLIGFQAENHGSMEASNGLAGIVAANQILIKPLDQQRIFIAANEVGDSVYSSAFSHPIEQDALEIDGEKLCQAVVSGTMISKGGQVSILGEFVALESGAFIDVSHPQGDGSVRIGGDLQGKNKTFPAAKITQISSDVLIQASATEKGNGGTVVIWSNDKTSFLGKIVSEGGPNGGNGAFVEVSGHRLDFRGDVSTLAKNGTVGTLLLDPLDIAISANPDNFVSGLPLGPTFAPTANTLCGSITDAVLNTGTLVNALNNNSVVIDTTATPAGCNGDIFILAPVVWSPAVGTRLTLNAAGTIYIFANILESSAAPAAGASIALISPIGINISSSGSGTEAFVGSRDGLTIIGDPAITNRCLRSHPTIQMASGPGGALPACSRIGFLIPPGGTATGAIDVTCGSLAIAANQNSVAAIGHGDNNAGVPNVMNTTSTATITVDTSGPIKIEALNRDAAAFIGHGSYVADMTSNFQGDICVTARNDIQITIPNPLPGGLTTIKSGIGHGAAEGSIINNLSGNISVFTNGNLTIDVRDNFNAVGIIGHYPAAIGSTVTGDIFVSASRNITLSSTNAPPFSATSNCHAFIGHDNLNRIPISTAASNISVSAGGNLCLKTGLHRSRAGIGVRATALTGIVSVSAVGNLSAINENDSANNVFRVYIGHESTNAALATSPTFVAIAGSIFLGDSLSGTNCCPPLGTNCLPPSGFSKQIVIQAPGDVNVAAGGDVQGIGTDNFVFLSFISTQNDASGTTRIYAGGTIQGFTSPGGSSFLLGIDNFGATTSSIDFRAGNSILMPNNFITGGTGSAFLGATTSFAASQLWTTNSNQLATVCNQAVPPLSVTTCSSCPSVNPLTFISASSPQVVSAPCGTLPGTNILIQTTSGPITLSNPTLPIPPSTPVQFCDQCNQCQILTLGPFPNSIQIATMTGDITISTFSDIVINQNITTAGTGSIDIEACRDCIVSSSFLVSASGTGSVDLAAGRDLVLNGTSVLTNSGPICLSAFQNANINETIQSVTGTITTLAGGDINMTSSLVQTSNAILMVAGVSLNMTGVAQINSTGSAVTIVVDNNFPAAPLIGPGALLMASTARIDAFNTIRIFSALSNLNTFGLLTVNGSPISFAPSSKLYEDTNQEVWCTYIPQPLFGCSSLASPFPGCGIFPAFLGTSSAIPLTVFYKDCLQQTTQQAMRIIDEFLVDLHPYDEFPGWVMEFWIEYRSKKSQKKISSLKVLSDEPYYLRRRHINLINHPKSWTDWWQ